MPEILGTLKPPRLATAPSSPALGQLYYDTGANVLYWWNGTTWISAASGSGGGTTVLPSTTLPASPTDGQQAILVDSTSAPTYSWQLQWSTTASRWLFTGGAPFIQEVQNSVIETTTSTTYVALTTAGPQFTCPRPGVYIVGFGMLADTTGASGGTTQSWMSFKNGPTVASDAWGVMTRNPDFTSVARATRVTVASAADALVAQYKAVNGTCRAQNRYMTVEPVYLT